MDVNKFLALMFECEECKKRFSFVDVQGTSLITHKREFKVNEQSIFLTYYDCPHCGKRHFVQIDDANSLEQLEKVNREFVKLATAKRKNKKLKNQSENFKKSRQYLSDYRINLMKEFTGKSAIDAMGIEYVLRFSI